MPKQYAGYEQVLIDIDPTGAPDIVGDARRLATHEAGIFDAVYCSHNLEHYYRHDVPDVLDGFLHVLKEGGFAQILVPDLEEVMRLTVERRLDIDDVLYQSPIGPVMVLDVLYGMSSQIEKSGHDFFAHKTGFTRKSLIAVLMKAGFSKIYTAVGNLEVTAVAFKGIPNPATKTLFGLPED